LASGDLADPAWRILFFQDQRGNIPVREFFLGADLTNGEKKQMQVRMQYLSQRGLQLVVERGDILEKVEGEEGLFELRFDNTPNNPRVLLCSAKGRQIVLLHAFKKKGRSLPAREITVAKHRREHWLSGERNDTVEKDA
jgi:phage-related protein